MIGVEEAGKERGFGRWGYICTTAKLVKRIRYLFAGTGKGDELRI